MVCLRAEAKRERRAWSRALFAAWHTEAFARVERLPDLGPMLARVSGGADDEQGPEEQLAAARLIAAALGGG